MLYGFAREEGAGEEEADSYVSWPTVEEHETWQSFDYKRGKRGHNKTGGLIIQVGVVSAKHMQLIDQLESG